MVDIYLGIGSNIEPSTNIAEAKELLCKKFPSMTFSRTFQSESIGFKGDDFLNLVAKFDSNDLSADDQQNQINRLTALLTELKDIEKQLGRERGDQKFSARKIDIDILLFGDLITKNPIELPREEILENAYVLWPLSELAADVIHLSSHLNEKISYLQHWQNFDHSKQQLKPIDLL